MNTKEARHTLVPTHSLDSIRKPRPQKANKGLKFPSGRIGQTRTNLRRLDAHCFLALPGALHQALATKDFGDTQEGEQVVSGVFSQGSATTLGCDTWKQGSETL